MKTIPLTHGKLAIVDDRDFEMVSRHKWSAHKSGKNWYASTNVPNGSGRQRTVKMHQLIKPAPPGLERDHRDGNGLNNRRKNLRVCRHANNCRNQSVSASSRSGVKGVDFHKNSGKWRARITVNWKVQHIGYFETRNAARDAYNTAAKKLHLSFARLNA